MCPVMLRDTNFTDLESLEAKEEHPNDLNSCNLTVPAPKYKENGFCAESRRKGSGCLSGPTHLKDSISHSEDIVTVHVKG